MKKYVLSVLLLLTAASCFAQGQPAAPESKEKSEDKSTLAAQAYAEGQYDKALTLFKELAEKGDVTAMNALGYMYDQGLGVAINETEALNWYQRAAKAKSADGAYNAAVLQKKASSADQDQKWIETMKVAVDLGQERAAQELYRYFLDVEQNDEAEKLYQKSLSMGQVWAVMGRALEGNMEDSQEEKSYLNLISTAAQAGDVSAQYFLAVRCEQSGDKPKAEKFYRLAAEKNYVPAQYGLGALLLAKPETKDEGLKWLNQASDAYYGPAMVYLGQIYETGKSGVTQSEQKAYELYKRAADSGDSLAMIAQGRMLESGKGVAQNIPLAIQMYRKASDKTPQGSYQMARVYLSGIGVERDPAQGVIWLKKATSAGDSQALRDLGVLTYLGIGVPEDKALGRKLVEQAIKSGNFSAKMDLAKMMVTESGDNAFNDKQLSEVMSLAKAAAEKGDPEAQLFYGRLLEVAGDEQSADQARQWYEKSAEGGSAEGCYVLATYMMDNDENPNGRQIVKLLLQASENGHHMAQFTLGRLLEQGVYLKPDRVKALTYYRMAAEGGEPVAQTQLGNLLLEGDEKNHPDPAQAAHWFQKASEQNYPMAYTSLARLYATGVGVSRNLKMAAQLYQKAAEQGNPQGQYNLGRMLLVGLGVWKDAPKGIEWIRKSAEQGYAPAQNQLGVLLIQGAEGMKESPYEALGFFLDAANQGYRTAQFNLGLLYASGKLGETSDQARVWFSNAATQGHAEACRQMGKLEELGRGGPVSLPKALWWYQRAQELGSTSASEDVRRLLAQVPEEKRLNDDWLMEQSYTPLEGSSVENVSSEEQ